MSIRPGMAALITRLRGMTHSAPDDESLASTTYFTDDMLQALLDSTRQDHDGLELIACPAYEDGAYVYREYVVPAYIPYAFEEPGTDSGWRAYNSSGVAYDPASDYSLNASAGRLSFSQDLGGARVWLDCRSYNLHRVAAEVWRQKAAFASENSNWRADNHAVDAAAIFAHCMAMADLHGRLAGPVVSKMQREG